MPGLPWTSDEDEILIKGFKAGLSIEDMRRILKSRDSDAKIRGRAKRLGIPIPRPVPEIDHEEFKRLMKGR